jgi:hypothetical protein
MPIVPEKALDKISYFENHQAVWSSNAVALGTTAAKCTSLTTKTTAARAAYNAQQLAQEQARVATNAFNNAVRAMALQGSDIIQDIKHQALTGGDAIYNLALIPPPAVPSPVPPPGMPTDFTAALNPDGTLTLKWKCTNPPGSSGTIYQVARKVGNVGDFQMIGGSGTRSFIDATLPAGNASVTYRIIATRSTAAGTANQFTVSFGVGGGGEMMASVASAGGAPRMAA